VARTASPAAPRSTPKACVGPSIDAVTSVQAALHEMLGSIPVLEPNISHSHLQHDRLVSAVVRGKPDRARRVMEEHCDDTAALLRGLLG